MKAILLTAVFGVLCFTGLLAAPAAGAVRLEIEAEDFDGVPLYPDWHTSSGQGWYAMEQRYFSGYAGLICDAQSVGASTAYTFKSPLPAGRYRFFLCLVKMRVGGRNSVEVAVGDQKWTVTWDENVARVRDYVVVPHDFVLTKPADRISIKSLLVERHNIGDVPSYPLPTIMLDRMVITDDLEQQVIESGGRQAIGRPEAVSGQPAAAVKIPAGNRVANGSFEVGTTTNWFSFGDPLQPKNLVGEAIAGRRCLELPQLSSTLQTAGICSGVFRGVSGEKVPVSLYLKSTAPVSVSVAVQNTARRETGVLKAAVTDKWERFSGEAVLPPDPEGAYSLIIRPEIARTPVRVFVDAVAVGLPAGTDYQARSPYEAGLAGTALANIYHDREKAPAILTLANHDRRPWPADLEILVRDHRDEIVARQPVKAACPAGSGLEQEVNLAAGRWGVFSAVVRDRKGGTDLAELCYINLPKAEGRNNFLGFYGSAWNDRNMAIFKELGIDFVATLADGSARHIRTDGFEALDQVLDAPARHGVGVFYATEILYHKPQENFQWPAGEGVNPGFAHPPALKSLSDDLYNFARRFAPKIESWCLQDELYEGKCPLNAWPLYHKTAVEAIRRADPEALITVSSEPAFQERVLKLLGPEYLSAVCDPAFSPMSSRRYNHLPFVRLAREYGIPLWFSGFGFPSVSFYRTRAADMKYRNPNYSELVDRMAMVLAANRLDFGADRFLLYSAVPVVLGPNSLRSTNIYDSDGSLIALVPAYAAIGRLMAGASGGRRLPVPDESLTAFAFQRGGESYLIFWVDPNQGVYGNQQAGDYRLELGLAGSVTDIFGNPYPVEKLAAVRTGIEFQGQPLLMNAGGVGVETIVKGMESAVFENRLPVRGYCRLDGSGQPVLRLVLENRSGRPFAGELKVEEERGLLVEGTEFVRMLDLASGRRATLDLACQPFLLGRRPLANGVAGVSMGSRFNAEFGIWAQPAFRLANQPALDGDPAGWPGAPAYIYATTRASGGYERTQVREGAEFITREKIIQASIYTGWDEQNLYLAVRNVDDEVNFPRQEAELGRGDRLVIGLDTRLEADIFETRRSEDDFLIQLDALAEKGRARLVNWRGEAVELPVGFRRVLAGADSGYLFLVSCPWEKLGVKPAAGAVLGFDVTLFETDKDRAPKIEAAWAGSGVGLENPTGYGQLILK